MGKDFSLSKNQRRKKLTKKMFGWEACEITSDVSVFFNINSNKNTVLVSVPKKTVKEAYKRNLLKRKAKEVFRLSVKKDKSVDYLIRFNRFAEGFESSLEDFFRNV